MIKNGCFNLRQPFFWGGDLKFNRYASSNRIGFKPYPMWGKQYNFGRNIFENLDIRAPLDIVILRKSEYEAKILFLFSY